MKYFTIKDFMLYNGPCFSCGKKIALSIHQLNHKYKKIPSYVSGNIISVSLFPIELKINISNNSYTTIWGGNNIHTYDPNYFNSFLKDNSLFLISSCRDCSTEIVSDDLKFDKKNVKPI